MANSLGPVIQMLIVLVSFASQNKYQGTSSGLIVFFSQANNAIVRTWGERRQEGNLKNHVDLCIMLDIVALEKGICSRTILCWLINAFSLCLD
jgi:hypothetical protein